MNAQTSAEWPEILEAKDIAEEGFIYGLPLVMNYAVMQEFAVDKNSGQFKAPFNEINNSTTSLPRQDTAIITPNSDTPYSMLWLDLRAEPMVISVPAIEEAATTRCSSSTAIPTIMATSAAAPLGPSRATIMVVGPDWKGGTPAGIKKVFRSTTPFTLALFRTQLFNPDDMSNVEKVQAGYKAQPLSVFLKQPAPPAAPKIDFLPADSGDQRELLPVSRRCAAVRPGDGGEPGDPRQARAHWHRPGQDL